MSSSKQTSAAAVFIFGAIVTTGMTAAFNLASPFPPGPESWFVVGCLVAWFHSTLRAGT